MVAVPECLCPPGPRGPVEQPWTPTVYTHPPLPALRVRCCCWRNHAASERKFALELETAGVGAPAGERQPVNRRTGCPTARIVPLAPFTGARVTDSGPRVSSPEANPDMLQNHLVASPLQQREWIVDGEPLGSYVERLEDSNSTDRFEPQASGKLKRFITVVSA